VPAETDDGAVFLVDAHSCYQAAPLSAAALSAWSHRQRVGGQARNENLMAKKRLLEQSSSPDRRESALLRWPIIAASKIAGVISYRQTIALSVCLSLAPMATPPPDLTPAHEKPPMSEELSCRHSLLTRGDGGPSGLGVVTWATALVTALRSGLGVLRDACWEREIMALASNESGRASRQG
jgi:hypothetical protein